MNRLLDMIVINEFYHGLSWCLHTEQVKNIWSIVVSRRVRRLLSLQKRVRCFCMLLKLVKKCLVILRSQLTSFKSRSLMTSRKFGPFLTPFPSSSRFLVNRLYMQSLTSPLNTVTSLINDPLAKSSSPRPNLMKLLGAF